LRELVKQGRKILEGEKDFIRREKKFKEKLQAFAIPKEEKTKKQIEEKERRERIEKERKEKSFYELDIDKLCEKLHEVKKLSRVESKNDIGSSIDNTC